MVKHRKEEAGADVWESAYEAQRTPWRSAGLGAPARRFLKTYAAGKIVLELGCGVGDDAAGFLDLGFDYTGTDVSPTAVAAAEKCLQSSAARFVCADCFDWMPEQPVAVVYDKGLFHGLAGVARRRKYVNRVAYFLAPGGIWITICGSADCRSERMSHSAIFLRDLIEPAEVVFEALEVVKARYGLAAPEDDFCAWHAVFRRR